MDPTNYFAGAAAGVTVFFEAAVVLVLFELFFECDLAFPVAAVLEAGAVLAAGAALEAGAEAGVAAVCAIKAATDNIEVKIKRLIFVSPCTGCFFFIHPRPHHAPKPPNLRSPAHGSPEGELQ